MYKKTIKIVLIISVLISVIFNIYFILKPFIFKNEYVVGTYQYHVNDITPKYLSSNFFTLVITQENYIYFYNSENNTIVFEGTMEKTINLKTYDKYFNNVYYIQSNGAIYYIIFTDSDTSTEILIYDKNTSYNLKLKKVSSIPIFLED